MEQTEKPASAEILAGILTTLRSIAPETADQDLNPGEPLRRQVDLDSMDWLNFLIALHQRFHVDIPEADYARLRCLDDIAAYLQAKTH
ncbi:acyl carrier protein [Noviherbaspirillum galbum]|uniref:Acyl carrier protein n=1 Tax=Noviherbaspirillum galbum TaxID=2709383 RepID=A0A6B3SNI1_9BURK|nr:phosphopantetheine-binding protein [Noviherbaspirillum galbum]NEX62364.1 acyl carrier protein [Noviherbaspirillum galbum]